LAEAIRSLNPCLFLLLRFEGWNVLFICYRLKFQLQILVANIKIFLNQKTKKFIAI